MFSLHPDLYFTRRNRLHYVLDHQGELVWSGKELLGALVFLTETDELEFDVKGDNDETIFHLTLRRA